MVARHNGDMMGWMKDSRDAFIHNYINTMFFSVQNDI